MTDTFEVEFDIDLNNLLIRASELRRVKSGLLECRDAMDEHTYLECIKNVEEELEYIDEALKDYTNDQSPE